MTQKSISEIKRMAEHRLPVTGQDVLYLIDRMEKAETFMININNEIHESYWNGDHSTTDGLWEAKGILSHNLGKYFESFTKNNS